MAPSEQKAIKVLEDALTSSELYHYVFTIQDYFADETNQLAIDNPALEDYLNNVIPEFTEEYDNTKRNQWLLQLRNIINQANSIADK